MAHILRYQPALKICCNQRQQQLRNKLAYIVCLYVNLTSATGSATSENVDTDSAQLAESLQSLLENNREF